MSIIVRGKKLPGIPYLQFYVLGDRTTQKYPTSTFYYKPRGAMVKIIKIKKVASQYWLDMKMDQPIHWNQTLNKSVNRWLLR